jgi:RNase P/RNase MRP subunit p29
VNEKEGRRMESAPIDARFQGEILGAPIHIDHAPGLVHLPVDGTLVDETMNLFVVRVADGRELRIPKSGVTGTIALDARELPLSGDALRVRPEDRTKRLAWRGRRRTA